ncbi:MAG: hypothetical protein JWR16_1057 [Nevskia sp.]|nr:hypothetical protein [Nevskia sp.]
MKVNIRATGLLLVLLAVPALADQAACIDCRKQALKAAQLCLLSATSDAAKAICHTKMDADVQACAEGACNY